MTMSLSPSHAKFLMLSCLFLSSDSAASSRDGQISEQLRREIATISRYERKHWDVNSSVWIYSKSQAGWKKGKIVKIIKENNEEFLEVHYAFGPDGNLIKEIGRSSELIRPDLTTRITEKRNACQLNNLTKTRKPLRITLITRLEYAHIHRINSSSRRHKLNLSPCKLSEADLLPENSCFKQVIPGDGITGIQMYETELSPRNLLKINKELGGKGLDQLYLHKYEIQQPKSMGVKDAPGKPGKTSGKVQSYCAPIKTQTTVQEKQPFPDSLFSPTNYVAYDNGMNYKRNKMDGSLNIDLNEYYGLTKTKNSDQVVINPRFLGRISSRRNRRLLSRLVSESKK